MKAEGQKTKFQLGDVVQVEKYYAGTRFKKGYQKNFTNELFVISACILRISKYVQNTRH